MKEWEKWEEEANKSLNLNSTENSGNKWYDPGDGVTHCHFSEIVFPLVIDCKSTGQLGFRLDRKILKNWKKKAQELGKIFAMPIRFLNQHENEDWIVLPFDDFSWLVNKVNSRDKE